MNYEWNCLSDRRRLGRYKCEEHFTPNATQTHRKTSRFRYTSCLDRKFTSNSHFLKTPQLPPETPSTTISNMPYTHYASVCGHAIRTSSQPNPSFGANGMDFSVRYCSDLCARGLQVRNERREAESAYESSRSRETRRAYDRSRSAVANYESSYQDRDDRERRSRGEETLREQGRRYAGLDDPDYLQFRQDTNSRYGQRARVTESSSHRPETNYRDQTSYRRSSRQYDAGRYADRSGSGYINTSDPPRRETHSPRRASSTSSRRSDAYLDQLGDDELAERRRRVRRAMERYA